MAISETVPMGPSVHHKICKESSLTIAGYSMTEQTENYKMD